MTLAEQVDLYRRYFIVREDVYGEYWVSGKGSGYSPACKNKFSSVCRLKEKGKCHDCPNRGFKPVTEEVIEKHILGQHICGFYPLFPNKTVRFLAFDFDSLEKDGPLRLRNCLKVPNLLTTSSNRGYHIYLFFAEPVPAGPLIRKYRGLTKELGLEIEIFPKQGAAEYLGSLLRTPMILPLMENGKSTILDDQFNPVSEPWEVLKNQPVISLSELNLDLDIGTKSKTELASPEEKGTKRDWKPPTRGDFEKIISGCEAIREIVQSSKKMTNEERVILLSFALSTRNGLVWLYSLMAQNPDFGSVDGTKKMDRAVQFAKKREEIPWSCQALMRRGYCKKEKFCLGMKEGSSPSPVRFAFLKRKIATVKNIELDVSLSELRLTEDEIAFSLGGARPIGTLILKNYTHNRPAGWRGRMLFFDPDNRLVHEDTLTLSSSNSRKAFENNLGKKEIYLDLAPLTYRIGQRLDQVLKEKEDKTETVPFLSDQEREEAIELLSDRPLYRIIEGSGRLGLVGEEELRLMAYLVFTSRILPMPLSLLVKGVPTSGKSRCCEKVAVLVPPEGIKYITRATPQSFFYLASGEMKHKIIYVNEIVGQQASEYAIRSMQSEGSLVLQVTLRNPATGELFVKEKTVEGPCGFLTTTTKTRISLDNETRNFSIYTDSSPKQTSKILELEARQSMGLESSIEQDEIRAIRNMQRSMETYPVLIPYAQELFNTFPKNVIRVRRDAGRVRRLIEIVTIIHQMSRDRKMVKGKEFLVSTLADYFIAQKVARRVILYSVFGLNPYSEAILQASQELGSDLPFSIGDIAKHTEIGLDVVRRNIRWLMENLFFERVGKSQYKRTRSFADFLPSIKDLHARFPCDPYLYYDPFTGERPNFLGET